MIIVHAFLIYVTIPDIGVMASGMKLVITPRNLQELEAIKAFDI
jgi:hypothetical protein